MTARTRWVLIIVGLLVGNVAMMGVLIAASTGSRPAIIPAYYERAVAFDGELDDAERSRALGWQVSTKLADDGITVEVRDRAGQPITDAQVAVTGFQRAHAVDLLDLALVATAGRYRGRRELRRGVYDLQVVVERAGARFVAHQTMELADR